MTTRVGQRGAALIEFAIVAVVLLGIILPGMISVGKSLSELNAAAQGSFLGVQRGADVKIPYTTGDINPDDINLVNAAITGRIDYLYPMMSPQARDVAVNPESSVTVSKSSEDPEHWMVQADMTAYFPAILTDIPVRVKSVSSMLNIQLRTGGDLTSPQRIRREGSVTNYNCEPRPCSGGNANIGCEPSCCLGFIPGGGNANSFLLREYGDWVCGFRQYGEPGELDDDDGG